MVLENMGTPSPP